MGLGKCVLSTRALLCGLKEAPCLEAITLCNAHIMLRRSHTEFWGWDMGFARGKRRE